MSHEAVLDVSPDLPADEIQQAAEVMTKLDLMALLTGTCNAMLIENQKESYLQAINLIFVMREVAVRLYNEGVTNDMAIDVLDCIVLGLDDALTVC